MVKLPEPLPGDEYLTIADVCKLMKLNRRSIYRNIKAGKFPAPSVRVNGRVVRWSKLDVLGLVAQ